MTQKRFGLVAARSKPEAASLASEIKSWLRLHDCLVVPETDLGDASDIDAIIVLGGDGLMMRAANAFPDVPLLGINFGKVGFLALVERRDWREALDALIANRFKVEEGATLAASLIRDGREVEEGWAINDVVLRAGVRMIDLEIYIDNHYVNTYPGDGMILATPHGSTAYGMAAGGPILTAGVRGIAIVPISCHSPIRTPLVVPEDAIVEAILVNDHEASMILDGRVLLNLMKGDVIKVRRGAHAFRLVSLSSTNFYEAFRTKFNFQIRPDAVPTRRPAREEEDSLHA